VNLSEGEVPLFLTEFNETRIISTDLRKILNIKFHFKNPSRGIRVVSCWHS